MPEAVLPSYYGSQTLKEIFIALIDTDSQHSLDFHVP